MNLMGVIVGPALNAFVANLDVRAGPEDAPVFVLNAETAAGYFPAILSFILFVGTLLCVEEPPPMEESSSDEEEDGPSKVLCSTGAWICLLLAFQTNLQLAAIDTILADLNEKVLGWDIVDNSIAFAIIAVMCLVGAALAMILLNKGSKCTTVIAIGLMFNFFVSVPGMWAVANYDVDDPEKSKPRMPLFLIMGAFQCIAIMFYTGPTGGIYQQACGKKQGLLGGLYLMFFAGGRPCGAMLGSTLLSGNTMAMVILTPVPIALCLFLLLGVTNRLNETDAKALAAQKEEGDLPLLRSLSRTLSTRGSFSGAEQVGR
jgi:predicted MFS family arabinose efflux permease